MVKKRCIVFIDGSNFYFKLKDLSLHNLLSFDFSGFLRKITYKYTLVETTYYIGKVRTDGTEKTKRLQANQQKLFAHLRRHKVFYSLGYLMNTKGRFYEKGVDVNIAVDMLIASFRGLADRFILISSDTDLLPAIREVKKLGKTVEYVVFSHRPSLAMIANCNESTLLKAEDLKPFLQKKS